MSHANERVDQAAFEFLNCVLNQGDQHANVKWTMLGLREVARAICNHKLKLVIVANDLEVDYGDLAGLPKQLGQGMITAKAVEGALAAAAAATAAKIARQTATAEGTEQKGAEQKGAEKQKPVRSQKQKTMFARRIEQVVKGCRTWGIPLVRALTRHSLGQVSFS